MSVYFMGNISLVYFKTKKEKKEMDRIINFTPVIEKGSDLTNVIYTGKYDIFLGAIFRNPKYILIPPCTSKLQLLQNADSIYRELFKMEYNENEINEIDSIIPSKHSDLNIEVIRLTMELGILVIDLCEFVINRIDFLYNIMILDIKISRHPNFLRQEDWRDITPEILKSKRLGITEVIDTIKKSLLTLPIC